MEKLIRGVHEFQSHLFSTQRELFERLAQGQHPDALFITCSDSRINPNLITQTQPGDLFILRNAGNIVPPYGAVRGGEEATIEYTVGALAIRDIVVCGHSQCGAMKALLEPDAVRSLPAVAAWLQHAEATRRIMLDEYPEELGDMLLLDTIKENVLVQLENLRTHPSVAAGLAAGRLTLHGWVYQIETGQVFAYDPKHRLFRPVVEAAHGQVPSPQRLTATHSI